MSRITKVSMKSLSAGRSPFIGREMVLDRFRVPTAAGVLDRGA
jgi:hypothetical protein